VTSPGDLAPKLFFDAVSGPALQAGIYRMLIRQARARWFVAPAATTLREPWEASPNATSSTAPWSVHRTPGASTSRRDNYRNSMRAVAGLSSRTRSIRRPDRW